MNEFFNIVQRLSMNEKRYFKTYTQSKSAHEMLDLINKNPNNLSVIDRYSPREKNYFFNTLLRSLREFHNNLSINRRLDNYIHDIDILINKEMHAYALRYIHKAEKLAEKHEKTAHRIALLRLKRKVNQFLGIEDEFQIQALNNKVSELSKQFEIELKLEGLMGYYRQSAHSGEEITLQDKLDKIMDELPDEMKNYMKSHYLYSRIMGFVKSHSKKYYESNVYYKSLIDRFENRVKVKSNSSIDIYSNINYISILHNQLAMLKQMDMVDEYLAIIEKLKKTKGLSLREENKSFMNFAISLTDFYLGKNEVKKGIEFIKSYTQNINKISSEPDRMELLYFNMVYLHFLDKNFKEANRILYKYLTKKKPGYKIIFKAATFVNILLQIELGKTEYALETLDKLLKKLRKNNFIFSFDESLAELIRYVVMEQKQENVQKKLDEFKVLVKAEKGSLNVNILNEHFNFVGWLESKLFNIPFRA